MEFPLKTQVFLLAVLKRLEVFRLSCPFCFVIDCVSTMRLLGLAFRVRLLQLLEWRKCTRFWANCRDVQGPRFCTPCFTVAFLRHLSFLMLRSVIVVMWFQLRSWWRLQRLKSIRSRSGSLKRKNRPWLKYTWAFCSRNCFATCALEFLLCTVRWTGLRLQCAPLGLHGLLSCSRTNCVVRRQMPCFFGPVENTRDSVLLGEDVTWLSKMTARLQLFLMPFFVDAESE